MKNKILMTIGILILIGIIICAILSIQKKINKDYGEITVTYYLGEKKTIRITDKKLLKKINNICKNIEKNTIDDTSAIIHMVEIELSNGLVIYIDNTVSDRCYIKQGEKTMLVKMPEGLLQCLKEVK